MKLFLSTPSARRATFVKIAVHNGFTFLSTPSARRATRCTDTRAPDFPISIHALREEGDRKPLFCAIIEVISIHALREEGDLLVRLESSLELFISIHALREEGDLLKLFSASLVSIFLSTPSARRATVVPQLIPLRAAYFYPRPPRGGRPIRRSGSSA